MKAERQLDLFKGYIVSECSSYLKAENDFVLSLMCSEHDAYKFQIVSLKSSSDTKRLTNFITNKCRESNWDNELKVACPNIYASFCSGDNTLNLAKTTYINSKQIELNFNQKIKGKVPFSKQRLQKYDMSFFSGLNLDIHQLRLLHLGVSVLAKTQDNYLVVLLQNINSDNSPGLLVPSGSGSLDWEDIENSQSDNLMDLLKYSICRELSEECDIDLQQVLKMQLILIDHFLWVERAFKPEFVGICQLDCKLEHIKPNENEVFLASGVYEKVNDVNELLNYCSVMLLNKKLSLPLRVIFAQLKGILLNEEHSGCKKVIQQLWFSV